VCFAEIMSRADASLHEYMNKLRQSRDGQSASVDKAGALAAVSSTTVPAAGASAAAKKRGRPPKENQEGRAGPSRTTSEPTLLAVGLDIVAHLQAELTAEENEIFATIPTTKLMVETLELQSWALMASRTVV